MNSYKVYKAKVTKVSIPDNKGETQRKIYVSPYPPDGSGTWERPANPPNVFPTNTLGSGLISYPEIGQECIVAEWRGERQILAYTSPRGLSPYGALIPDNLKEGALRFGIKGLNEALIKMTKEGQVTIYSQTFAQMGVDGSSSTTFTKSKTHTKDFAGGFEYNNYDEETKNTASISMFIHKKDNPVFSDHYLRIEEVTGKVVPDQGYEYKNKAIIRSGYIEDGEHPWELQTRQNIGANNAQDKNVVTLFRVGYQKAHERYGGDQYPEGTLLEWSAKKNKPGDVGLFKFRYGKLNNNTPNSDDEGELLGIYAYEGLKTFGKTISDPVGEGKGWGVDYEKKAKEVFIHSVGRRTKSDKSFERKYLKDEDGELDYSWTLGGEESLKNTIKHGDLEYSRVLTLGKGWEEHKFSDFSVKETLDKKWSVEYEEGSSKDSITVEKDKIVIENDSGDKIELSGGKITLKSGGTEIIIDKSKVSMETGSRDIILDQKGFRANGKKLIFESAIKAIANTPSISVSAAPGSPAPIFPALKVQLGLPIHRTSL